MSEDNVMKLSEYIKKLQEFLDENGDMDAYYALAQKLEGLENAKRDWGHARNYVEMVRGDGVIICSVEEQVHYPVAQEDACVLINRLIQEKQELKSALSDLVQAGEDVVDTSMLGGSILREHYELEVDSYQRIEESVKKAREVLDNEGVDK